ALAQPQMEYAWRGLGDVLARSGARDRAIDAYRHALDFECRGKDAWFALGSLLTFPGTRNPEQFESDQPFADIARELQNGRMETADARSRAALESQPGNPAALKLRADVLIRQSRWPEAKLLLK